MGHYQINKMSTSETNAGAYELEKVFEKKNPTGILFFLGLG